MAVVPNFGIVELINWRDESFRQYENELKFKKKENKINYQKYRWQKFLFLFRMET